MHLNQNKPAPCSASLLADDLCNRSLWCGPGTVTGNWSGGLTRPTDDALRDEAIDHRSGVQGSDAGNGDASICDDNVVSITGSFDPSTQVGSEFGDCNIHIASVLFNMVVYVQTAGLGARVGGAGSANSRATQVVKCLNDQIERSSASTARRMERARYLAIAFSSESMHRIIAGRGDRTRC